MVPEVTHNGLLESPIVQALLWACGVSFTIIGWFIVHELNRQSSKDQEQDERMDKMDKVLEGTHEILGDMRTMLAKHDTDIKWLISNLEKSTRK
jgi:hypothetical protein